MGIYARALNKNIAIAMRYTKQVDEQHTRNFMQCIVDEYLVHGSNRVLDKSNKILTKQGVNKK